jgi:DNA-binding MarR family transcriptional regulator
MVKLTKKSRPFINRINQNHVKIHKEILDQVKSNNQAVVIEVMQNVVNALKAYNKK